MEWPDQFTKAGCRVAVLSGGSSSERDVSLVSGKAVIDALEQSGIPCELFELKENSLPSELDPSVHLVLPIVHGSYGEDGCLSADLERYGFAYVGCDQASSVLCFDKLACKAIAARIGLPVAPDRLLVPGEKISFEDLQMDLGPTIILKPRRDGSSVGLHLVRDLDQFVTAGADLEQAEYLAESYIEGCDLTVGIIWGKAMGVVGVYPEGGLYDYDHKYTTGMSRYEVPADLPMELASQLRDWSLGIFKACNCRDMARVDFRMGLDNIPVFLEVNTLPGMTATSLLPKSAECFGVSFKALVETLAGYGFQRMKGLN